MQFFTDNVLERVRAQMIKAGRIGHVAKSLATGKFALQRARFNPTNPEHRQIYADFLVNGSWNGNSFYVEAPAITVPRTCELKLIEHYLRKEIAVASDKKVSNVTELMAT